MGPPTRRPGDGAAPSTLPAAFPGRSRPPPVMGSDPSMSVVEQIRMKGANRLGRSDRSALGRWFWEIDRVLLFFVAVLIVVGLVAVAAASPAAGQRYSGGDVSV